MVSLSSTEHFHNLIQLRGRRAPSQKKGLKSSCCLWLATHYSAVINSAEACRSSSRTGKGLLETIRDLATKRLQPGPLKSLVFCGVERILMNMKLKSLSQYVKLSQTTICFDRMSNEFCLVYLNVNVSLFKCIGYPVLTV